MNRPAHAQLARVVAALIILATMSTAFGIPGGLAAALTIAVLASLPPMYGFAVGQLALAVLAPIPLRDLLQTPAVLGTHLGLLLALWSDLTAPANYRLVPVAVASTVLLVAVAGVAIGETESLWLPGGILLASIVFLAYALHRYTVVFVLEEASP